MNARNQTDAILYFVIETYGVRVRIETNDGRLRKITESIARKAFLNRLAIDETPDAVFDHSFGILRADAGILQLFENGKFRSDTADEGVMLRFFTSILRVTVAERAKPWVFVHAGVVGINGKAIVIPGNSYTGKTTLIAELVKRGAEYFSDEYAVFDENGLVHPFARDLSIRINGDRLSPERVSVEDFGGVSAVLPAPVGLVLLTEFKTGEVWEPERLTLGNGIKELIPHTVPIRFNTEFSLKVLNKGLSRAIIIKGLRSDAGDFADALLSFMDNDLNWSAMTLV